jgi:macrolide transport system ATP-binding/permease protein
MSGARLELKAVKRIYANGDEIVEALAGVDLVIEQGELIAIVGASGSGKSTLMNVLGCLVPPSEGKYRVAGVDVSTLDPDGVARLRRDHFGFIFQRYHLLGTLSSVGNIELPAVYADMPVARRREMATGFATRLGLAERLDYRPSQLSGGQQQRVAIARALMNGAQIILADEPTGALDSRSGETVLSLLKELHAEGRTVIMVTHDRSVAAHADRIIEIVDGRIVADSGSAKATPFRTDWSVSGTTVPQTVAGYTSLFNAFAMSLRSMAAHKLRTALTMLGIIIGIVSVVAVLGLGEGARTQVLGEFDQLGTSTITIYPGLGWNDPNAAKIVSLTEDDADLLSGQSYVDSATPEIVGNLRARHAASDADIRVSGVGEGYARTSGLLLKSGRSLSVEEIRDGRPAAVISEQTQRALFEGENPLGATILLGNVPFAVVGIVASSQSDGQTLQAYVAYSAMKTRILGNVSLGSIIVRVKDGMNTDAADQAITSLLTGRHGVKDFFTVNSDQLRRSAERTMGVLSLLISSLAAVALVVGGIGVMNIMLVSVTERTKEIGLRMAIGARRSDIMLQFVIEAISVCLVGGAIGVLLALGLAISANMAGLPMPITVTWKAVVMAFASTTLIGLIFGFLPARNASRLDPVEALTSE